MVYHAGFGQPVIRRKPDRRTFDWQKGNAHLKRGRIELLTLLNLAEFADRHPATLSGGQKQRLALAVALLNEAPVIVLDEPTSGLDGRNMRSVSKQLRALAEKGHIILMITHDLECALATCSRALVIRDCTLADDFQIDNAERLMGRHAGITGGAMEKERKSSVAYLMQLAGKYKLHLLVSALFGIASCIMLVYPVCYGVSQHFGFAGR